MLAYYQGDQFYASHSPPGWFEKERGEYLSGLWHAYFRYIAKVSNREWLVADILDYGCGGGWYMLFLQAISHHNIFGVEPSETARMLAIAMGIEDQQIKSNIEQFDEFGYNVISLQLVLEHVVDPEKFLKETILPKLYGNGRLLITVPNDLSSIQKKIGYEGYVNPVHINYFTPVTLRAMLQRLGLRVVHESATFPMELFVLLGFNYIGNNVLGQKCHRFRLKLERAIGPDIYHIYKYLYKVFGIGRELIFVAEWDK